MRIILTIALIATISLTAFSQSNPQNLQTYSGAFEGGTATYQYYENNQYERVYHGDFKSVYNLSRGTLTLTGKFLDDKKDGIWKATVEEQGGVFGNYSTTVTGLYIKGDMEGTWTYQVTSEKTGKIVRQSTAHFKKNLRIGAYEFTIDEENTIKYSLNNEGFIDGEYAVDFTDRDKVKWQHKAKFKNGIMFFSLYRNLSTGEVIEKIDITEALNEFFSLYDTTKQVAIFPKYEPNRFYGFILNRDYGVSPYKFPGQEQQYVNVPFELRNSKNFIFYRAYAYLEFIPLNFWDAESSISHEMTGGTFLSMLKYFIRFERGSTVPQHELMRYIVFFHLKRQ